MAEVHLGDEPTENDLLGFTPLVENLSTLILEMKIEDTPLCVGVYGEWGSGKTSFLKMVTRRVRLAGGIQSIWFNAWKYDREENLWAALLHSIFTGSVAQGTFRQRATVKWRLFWHSIDIKEGLWTNLRRILPALFRLAIIIFFIGIALLNKDPAYQTLIQSISQKLQIGGAAVRTVLAGLVLSLGGSNEVWKLANARVGFDFDALWKKRSYKRHIAFLDEFQEELRKLVPLVCHGRPMCIVIDDLDRCLPAKAIGALEAIKQFLDVPGCIFLVALDQELLERAVAVKFRELVQEVSDDAKERAQARFASAYVEKIIQLPLSLPSSRAEGIVSFIKALFPEKDTSVWEKIFAVGLSRNPRKVKRALRVFQFLEVGATAQVAPEALSLSLLAKLVVLQHEARDLFLQIARQPDLLVAMEITARDSTPPPSSNSQALLAAAEERLGAFPDIRTMLALKHEDDAETTHDAILMHLNFMMLTLEPTTSKLEAASELHADAWQRYSTVLGRETRVERNAYIEPRFRPRKGADIEGADPADKSLYELVTGSLRVLVVGGAGTGKTSCLNYTVSRLAREYAQQQRITPNDSPRKLSSPRLIPISVRCGDLAQYADLLAACVTAVQRYMGVIIADAVLFEEFTNGNVVIFLDGFDELSIKNRAKLSAELSSLLAQYPACRVVILTRPISELPDRSLAMEVFEIQPFDDQECRDFVGMLVEERGLPAVARVKMLNLLSSPAYSELGSIPLFIQALFEIFEQRGEVPAGRARILSALTDLFLFERDAAKGILPPVELSTAKLILAQIAYRLTARGEHRFGLKDIEASCVALGLGDRSLDHIVHHLLDRTGLLLAMSVGEFGFLHRTIEEYFAAEGLLRELERSLDVVETLDKRWQPILAYAVELGNRDLVGAILGKLLATASGLELFAEVIGYADAIGMQRMSEFQERLLKLLTPSESADVIDKAHVALEALAQSSDKSSVRPVN